MALRWESGIRSKLSNWASGEDDFGGGANQGQIRSRNAPALGGIRKQNMRPDKLPGKITLGTIRGKHY
jgi:hypothetical protein